MGCERSLGGCVWIGGDNMRKPTDYQGKYVARVWTVDKPTNIVAVAESLMEIRKAKPPEMLIMERYPNDNPVIAETWI